MTEDVSADDKEFYAARMSLLENMGSADKKEMYRDINDLREEIVKILHEFGATDKEKIKSFSLDQNLSKHASKRAYSSKKSPLKATEEEGTKEVVDQAKELQISGRKEAQQQKTQPPELPGQNQHSVPFTQLSHEWAKTLCERLKHIANNSKAPLASNGYDFYGLSRVSEHRYGSKSHSSYRATGQPEINDLYSADTLFEAIGKLKVVVDRLHRDSTPSIFQADEVFKQLGSKSYYHLEMRELLEYGCSMIPKCLTLLSGLEVFENYYDLHPENAQIGVDDMIEDSYYRRRHEEGLRILKECNASESRSYCRKGVPAEVRSRFWASCLGIKDDVISNSKKRWLASLHKKRRVSKLLIEKLVEVDINSVLDSDHYFPFEDILKSTLLAFLLDDKVSSLCQGDESARPKLYGFGESGSNHGLYPPCGIIPFTGMSWYAAPLTFLFGFQNLSKPAETKVVATNPSERYLQRPFSASQSLKGSRSTQSARERRKSESLGQKLSQAKQKKELSENAKQVEDHARCYYLFRALYCRYFCKLHAGPYDATSGSSPSLLGLCQLFEDLMEQTEPEVNYHLHGIIGISPLALAFPWICHAFADVLVPEQVLLLWDRVLGFDSLIPLVLLAVAIFHYRKDELLETQNMDEVNLFLDLKEVVVVPWLQNFIEHLGAIVASRSQSN